MKSIENKPKLPPFIKAAVIIFLAGALILWALTKCFNDPEKLLVADTIVKTVDAYKDKIGEDRAKVETTISPIIAGISEEQYNRVKKALDLKEGELLAMTSVNAQLQDSLKVTKVSLDSERNKVWNWDKKTETGSVLTATMNEKDSVLHASVDVKTETTDYVKRGGLFGKDKYYTDFYTPDQNIKFNGARTFRKETVEKPKKFGIGVQFGYGLTENFKAMPYVGIGLSYNVARF